MLDCTTKVSIPLTNATLPFVPNCSLLDFVHTFSARKKFAASYGYLDNSPLIIDYIANSLCNINLFPSLQMSCRPAYNQCNTLIEH